MHPSVHARSATRQACLRHGRQAASRGELRARLEERSRRCAQMLRGLGHWQRQHRCDLHGQQSALFRAVLGGTACRAALHLHRPARWRPQTVAWFVRDSGRSTCRRRRCITPRRCASAWRAALGGTVVVMEHFDAEATCAGREAPHHPLAAGADDVRAHAQAARCRRARRTTCRSLEVRDPRRRALPGAGQGADDRLVGPDDLGVLRRHRGQRHDHGAIAPTG
jgi:hypothetical protein